jgi:hypothetical protein
MAFPEPLGIHYRLVRRDDLTQTQRQAIEQWLPAAADHPRDPAATWWRFAQLPGGYGMVDEHADVVALGHLGRISLPSDIHRIEPAWSVSGVFQRRGLGYALAELLAEEANHLGVQEIKEPRYDGAMSESASRKIWGRFRGRFCLLKGAGLQP